MSFSLDDFNNAENTRSVENLCFHISFHRQFQQLLFKIEEKSCSDNLWS